MISNQIKCNIKRIQPLIFVCLLLISLFLAIIAYLKKPILNNQTDLLFYLFKIIFLVILPFFFSVYKLLSLVSVEIKNKKFIINYPFAFKTIYFQTSDIEDIHIEIIKPAGDGAGFIQAPYKKITLVFSSKKIVINSKTHSNTEELEKFLRINFKN